MKLQDALETIVNGGDLTQDQAADTFRIIMSGDATPAQIGALLAALRVKGETPAEIAGAASTMRSLATQVTVDHPNLIDTCGTGGSGTKLFNISTAAAFVAAAAGARVAKHGNRKMTSFCGSADLLEAAGVNLQLSPQQIGQCVNEIGVGFMFAQAHHSAMRFAGPVRQEIGIRTMMNVLGPMTNPAGARRQVIGVFATAWQNTMAEVLKLLGSEHALIVHSDGLDEFRLDAPTRIVELREGTIQTYDVAPETLGIASHSPEAIAALSAQSVAHSLQLVQQSLCEPGSAAADIVALNAGAGIYVAGLADDLKAGFDAAQKVIADGTALARLEALASLSHSLGTA